MGLQAIAIALLALLCAAQSGPTPLQRFLARGEEPPVEYRALRRLEANNPKFNQSAWMTAWTEFDRANGFRFTVAAEGGSGYIRSKVLRAALEGEQKIWANREAERASFTDDNYTFDAAPPIVNGTAQDLKFAKTSSGGPITKNPNFGQPLAYQDPFSARLGLRLTF